MIECQKCHKPATSGPIRITRPKSLWPWEKQQEGVSLDYVYYRWTHLTPKRIRPAVLSTKIDEILKHASKGDAREVISRLQALRSYANRKSMRQYCYLRVEQEEALVSPNYRVMTDA